MSGQLNLSLTGTKPVSVPMDQNDSRRLRVAVPSSAETGVDNADRDREIINLNGRHESCRDLDQTGFGTEKTGSAGTVISQGLRELKAGSDITPSSKGERTSETGIPHAVPLTREEECSLTLSSSPGFTGERGRKPGYVPPGSVRGSETAETGPSLRPYQRDAIASVERELADKRATLLVLPTGTGKTVVFAELSRREVAHDGRVLVLAHRTELLEQAANKLRDVGVRAALEQGQLRADPRVVPIVVASVQTLRGARLERYPVDAFSLVVVDEAHHTAATSYRAILDRFAGAKVLGVTATPDRGDGRALGKIFESVAYSYDMRTAIREKYLAPLAAKRIEVENLDLREVKTHHGDFDQGQLSELLNDERNLRGVVDPLVREAGDRRTLVFGVDVAHARALAEVLNSMRPGCAMALDGTAKREERAAVLALFRRGAFQYLCNCALFTEGFDEPSIGCVAMARPTQSRALYTQMLGRGTRLAPGKADCLVLDFVGNSGKHKLVGPLDALAGREVSDEARAIAQKALDDGQAELDGVLEHAEQEAEAQKRARRAKLNDKLLVEYRSREIDLFLGDVWVAFDPDSPAAQRPATAEQLEAIVLAKLATPPAGISEAEARAMLDAVAARRKAGLCTVPQARLLEKLGFNTKGMTFERAGQLIPQLKAANWKPWLVRNAAEYQPNRRRA